MHINTHLKIDQTLNGSVIEHAQGYAKVALLTTSIMVADEAGLVHGGFIFGAGDYCAMVAVNDPFVVLAKSEVKFIAPVRVGEEIIFEGRILEEDGKRVSVEVIALVAEKKVFSGTFYTAILEKHPLH
jgi:acyl-coenzyme A thioesterase PaaI-like protein